jgi:hypothetical protein
MIIEGAVIERQLEDGRILYVTAMTFGKARLCIGNQAFVDNGW